VRFVQQPATCVVFVDRLLETMVELSLWEELQVWEELQEVLASGPGGHPSSNGYNKVLQHPEILAMLTFALQADVSVVFVLEEDQRVSVKMTQLLWEAMDSAYCTVRTAHTARWGGVGLGGAGWGKTEWGGVRCAGVGRGGVGWGGVGFC
jgi:hypothetical protein